MKAVIMAGGFGTRIQPLTNSIPKPMLPIMNRPMMEHILKRVKSAGITDIVVLLYFKPEVITDYFKDGSDFGVNITYVRPDDDYGTAGAVKKAEKYLDETFIVVSGDLVTDFDFKEIIGFHQVKNSKLTITLTSVDDPLQFGVVITDKEGRILRFLEKPGWGEVFSDTINTGIYIIEPEILKYIPENVPFDFSKDLFPLLMKQGITLYGFKAKGYWRDVGNPESYREVFKDIFSGKVKVFIPGEKFSVGNGTVYAEEGTKLPDDIKIEGTAVLGKHVSLKKGTHLKDVVIGDKTEIGENTSIEDSVLWWDVKIGENCKFNNSVICNNVEIGNNVKAEKGVIIAEKTEVEDNVVFEKDVIVWPEKFIEEGSIVSSNLIWGEKWKKTVFEGGKVSGRTNIELSCEMAAKLGETFGSILPKGSVVLMSRDYHRASRMLKRAFLGGLLSTGINVIDMKLLSPPVMRYLVLNTDAVAGVHFRQSPSNPTYTEILFYDNDGVPIDTNTEKSLDRIFFRERFRRVNFNEIGEIKEQPLLTENYKEAFLSLIDAPSIKSTKFKIVADVLNGALSTIYPKLLNELGIENITLNAYFDEKKLANIPVLQKTAIDNVARIVKTLDMNAGFVLFPSGHKLKILLDTGENIPNHKALLMILLLIDKTIDKQVKAYLPVSAPDVLDELLENVIIERGKTTSLKSNFLKDYYFFGNIQGNYTFTQLSFSPDSMFTSVKILEMLSKTGESISSVLNQIPDYFFKHIVIGCPTNLKGKMMRKFTEEAMDKEASFIDGVKIFEGGKNWVLMIPDQYEDIIHLYIQAENEEKGKELIEKYTEKINKWLTEKE
ncbi:MAG: NTP transferase domain-containing protein [Aquificae bacterium]|nr:NTP transferase domain-containing protein [Aquificota bacterium]